jgi:hypothetical protein
MHRIKRKAYRNTPTNYIGLFVQSAFEASTLTNLIVFGLTRPGLEPTIYHTRDEHAIHYTTNAVASNDNSWTDSVMTTFCMYTN